jgi:DNA-binding NtrC family response regulator
MKPKATILVIDDYKDLVESIAIQLHYCGFEVIKATDPKRALELSTQIKPDLIIADIRMPRLDGLTLIKRFKASQPRVKVILMTGYYPDYEDVIKKALQDGLADQVIRKRFRALELERMVYDLLKSPEAEVRSSADAKGKILFVDDEVEVLDFLRSYYAEQGFAVSIAKNADDAVAAHDTFEPDLIVTDIKMPARDGVWLIQEIRKRDPDVKWVVMTGQDTHPVLQRLRDETGITTFFSKPFGLKELEKMTAQIKKLVKQRKK